MAVDADIRAQQLLERLSVRAGAMEALLAALARVESPTDDADAQDRVRRLLADALRRLDFRVRRVRAEGAGDHLYARPERRVRAAPRQLLVGHMDTVWPVGTLEEMPVERRDGRLYGPGVVDMKGGLVEIVFALEALHELGIEPDVTPVVFFNSDEETGSLDSSRLIGMLARGAERAFVLETGSGSTGKLKIARKGVGRFRITVRGRAAHAGTSFEEGVSAIVELSHQVGVLHALNDPARGITVNVGTIDGGLRPNVVAPEASAMIGVRAPDRESAELLERAILSLEPSLEGAEIEVEGGFGRPPMEPLPRNRALLESARRLGELVGVEVEDAGLVGGGSDANTTSLYTATLDGLGPLGGGAHASHEHVRLAGMPARTALLALLLLEPAAAR